MKRLSFNKAARSTQIYISIFVTFTSLISFPLIAEEKSDPESINDNSETIYRAPVIDVIGGEEDSLNQIPGSAEVISQDSLDLQQPINLQDIVRDVPGVHIRNEDGVGLIPNIGIRGLNPDRSEKLLILEDGMPAGLAPYNVNAAYYVPPIERMERVEVLKGSGSILYGPQTVGGVLNLITPEVPKDYRSKIRFMGGTDTYLMGHGNFGKTWGPFGLDVSILHKQGDGFRDYSDFRLTNLTAKMKFDVSDKTKIILKNNFHDQHSSQTYLGLTQNLFDQDSDFNPAQFDRYDVRRYDMQFTLQHFFSDNIELLTNIYYWNARRKWNRQDFARNTGFAPPSSNTSAVYGDTSIDGGAIYMRDSFGSRDRWFQGVGIEPRLLIDYDAFGKTHHLHTGLRFHYESMVDKRNNRETLISAPVTFSEEHNHAYAFAFFFQNTFQVTEKLSVIPGFRYENYTQKRDILRSSNEDVNLSDSTNHNVLIPGLGITYQLPGNTTLFTGIHRGFAPPRTAQAISSEGEDLELDAEYSWNYELGVRTRPYDFWNAEATFFFMHFENQVVPANESGGASTADTNAGETRHLGIEFASAFDMLGAAGFEKSHQLFLDTRYTFVEAENDTAGGLYEGNELPYSPKHRLLIGLRYIANEGTAKGLSLGMEANYISRQFADQANTVEASADGTNGIVPAYWLFNAYAQYQVPKTRLRLHVTANNILNNKYIVSRAPRGIFPGPGLQVLGGFSFDVF